MNIRASASLCFIAISAAGQLAATDNPFVGKWKLDPSKSEFSGPTMKIEKTGKKYRFSAGGDSYTFETNGKEQPSLYGRVVSWKQVDPNTWERTTKMRGNVLNESTLTTSADAKSLTETTKGTRPDGEAFESTTVYDRVGEGSGPLGTWKSKSVKMSAPASFDIGENGTDGIAFNIPAMKAQCLLKFDGKDYPAAGPTVPEGLTLAATKAGDRAFTLTQKIKGKPLFKSTYEVSTDGKTLTTTGSPVAVNEPTKAVYDRE